MVLNCWPILVFFSSPSLGGVVHRRLHFHQWDSRPPRLQARPGRTVQGVVAAAAAAAADSASCVWASWLRRQWLQQDLEGSEEGAHWACFRFRVGGGPGARGFRHATSGRWWLRGRPLPRRVWLAVRPTRRLCSPRGAPTRLPKSSPHVEKAPPPRYGHTLDGLRAASEHPVAP